MTTTRPTAARQRSINGVGKSAQPTALRHLACHPRLGHVETCLGQRVSFLRWTSQPTAQTLPPLQSQLAGTRHRLCRPPPPPPPPPQLHKAPRPPPSHKLSSFLPCASLLAIATAMRTSAVASTFISPPSTGNASPSTLCPRIAAPSPRGLVGNGPTQSAGRPFKLVGLRRRGLKRSSARRPLTHQPPTARLLRGRRRRE